MKPPFQLAPEENGPDQLQLVPLWALQTWSVTHQPWKEKAPAVSLCGKSVLLQSSNEAARLCPQVLCKATTPSEHCPLGKHKIPPIYPR